MESLLALELHSRGVMRRVALWVTLALVIGGCVDWMTGEEAEIGDGDGAFSVDFSAENESAANGFVGCGNQYWEGLYDPDSRVPASQIDPPDSSRSLVDKLQRLAPQHIRIFVGGQALKDSAKRAALSRVIAMA